MGSPSIEHSPSKYNNNACFRDLLGNLGDLFCFHNVQGYILLPWSTYSDSPSSQDIIVRFLFKLKFVLVSGVEINLNQPHLQLDLHSG